MEIYRSIDLLRKQNNPLKCALLLLLLLVVVVEVLLLMLLLFLLLFLFLRYAEFVVGVTSDSTVVFTVLLMVLKKPL